MTDRLEIASRVLAHVLAVNLVTKGDDRTFNIHHICEGCLDAADALIKSEKDTKKVAADERQLLIDLSKADMSLPCLADLKERATQLFGVGW